MVLRARIQETPTGNVFIDSLVSGYEYYDTAVPAGSPITITYRLTGSIAWTTDNAGTAFRSALDQWAAVANVRFVESSSSSATWNETLYSNTSSSTLGQHYFPNTQSLGGEFNVGHPLSTATNNARGGIGFVTYLHELGHGLGLNHSFEPDPFPGVDGNDPYDRGDNNFNNGLYTVMAYDDDVWLARSPGYGYGYAATPMAFDVAAVQSIYGANMATATGNDSYVLPSANGSGTFWACIWDAGGTDTIRAAVGSNASCEIDLRAATLLNAPGGGGWISRQSNIYGGFTIANAVTIENAIGGGGVDALRGNDVANRIEGLGGNDSIYGYDGADILIGGAGADSLFGGTGADLFTYTLASDSSTTSRDIVQDFVSGTDKIDLSGLTVASYSITGAAGQYYLNAVIGGVTLSVDVRSANGFVASDVLGLLPPEILLTTGDDVYSATAGDDVVRGLAGNDQISGLGGIDTLDGGAGLDRLIGGAGADLLIGGADADSFVYTAASDSVAVARDVIQDFVSGIDRIDLSALTVTGYSIGGGAGSFILDAVTAGGTLSIDVRSANGFVANDVLGLPPVDLNLKGTAADETLTGGTGNDRMRGLAGADVLIGLAGNDSIDGGAGIDRMEGGAGNESYYVDDAADVVVELAGMGTDTIYSTAFAYTLGDDVEVLILRDGAVEGTGNALDNLIIGTALDSRLFGMDGKDTLSGREGADYLDGGTGDDAMEGGVGDDTYIIDSRRDKVSELANGGIDTIEIGASTYRMSAEVENAVLTAGGGTVYGNDSANRLAGNAADNFLYGGGGGDVIDGGEGRDIIRGDMGTDTVTGGGGNDLIRYMSNDFGGLLADDAERVTDFSAAEGDQIDLRLVDAIAGGADDIFAFIGAAAFSGAAGELRTEAGSGYLMLLGDRDGNGTADLAIRLDGLTSLEASAVLL